jgi:RNA polymerase sigma-70 factor, ECF subfamily
MPDALAPVIPRRKEDISAIYDTCHQDLFGFAAAMTRDHAAAEDLVHEAFARLLRETAAGRAPDNSRAWLYTVCTNLARSRARRRSIAVRWQQLLGREHDGDTAEAAEQTVLRRERTTELSEALGSLPSDQRAALLLAADGFSGREIAGIIRRTEGATRNILWRGRLALKDQFDRGDRP